MCIRDRDTPEGYEVIDATGKTVMPGLIDTHLHFSEIGRAHV